MKNRDRTKIWELTEYLVFEQGATVTFNQDEITVEHPTYGPNPGDHTHRLIEDNNILDILTKIVLEVDTWDTNREYVSSL